MVAKFASKIFKCIRARMIIVKLIIIPDMEIVHPFSPFEKLKINSLSSLFGWMLKFFLSPHKIL